MSDQPWNGIERRVQSFLYPPMQPSALMASPAAGLGSGESQKHRDAALQQEFAAAVEAARKQGFQDGKTQASEAAAKALEQERAGIQRAVQEFVAQRREYFRRVESDAVRLALSIARKILHREAQMDPLLLAGVVRVALDNMSSATKLVLRTSPEAAPVWATYCSEHMDAEHQVEVIPDEALKSHQCRLKTEVGNTEISLDGQLQEIERGFFDLLPEAQSART